MAEMTLRQLDEGDAVAYQRLRLRGLKEDPTAYGTSYAQEAAKDASEFVARVTPEADGSRCTFGVFVDDQLAGMLTFIRPRQEKILHWAELVGMYVAPEFRRHGYGRALMEAGLAHARSVGGLRQVKLCVNATNTAARCLYQSLGFTRFGVEPDVLFIDGQFYDEELYLLRLL